MAALAATTIVPVAVPLAGATPAPDAPLVRVVIDGVEPAEVDAVLAETTAVSGRVGAVERLDALDAVAVEVPASRLGRVRAALADPASGTRVVTDGRARALAVTPNDPLWALQDASRAVRLPEVWQGTTGDPATTIAIVDSGVTANAELGSRLLSGWDYVDGDADTTDPVGHGTSAALVAAAGGNDGRAGAGACWQCRVLPVRVLDTDGSGYLSHIAAGIVFAADRGASVINLSLGASQRSLLVADAVRYALGRGAVVVAAAGNDGSYEPVYPAAEPGVLAVVAADSFTSLHDWSQRGPWVDLAAPGCNLAAIDDAFDPDDVFCGTSSAAPLVSGAAALLRSSRPGAGRVAVANALLASGRAMPAEAAGRGFLDAAAAMASIDVLGPTDLDGNPADFTPPTSRILAQSRTIVGSTTFVLNGLDEPPGGVRAFDLIVDGTTVASVGTVTQAAEVTWDSTTVADGPHTVQSRAIDSSGNSTLSDPVTVRVDNHRPTTFVLAPTRAVRGRTITVGVASSDTIGTVATFLALDDRVVAGFVGDGARAFPVRLPATTGRRRLLAASIDEAGNIAFSNIVWVDVRRR